MVFNTGDARISNQYPHQRTKSRSYAKVVVTGNRSVGRREFQGYKHQTSITSHSSLQLSIPMEQVKRFYNTWVGRLRKLSVLNRLEDKLMWETRQELSQTILGMTWS